MRIALMLFGLMMVLFGCQHAEGDDDLRAVPVTNNPRIVPSRPVGPIQPAKPY